MNKFDELYNEKVSDKVKGDIASLSSDMLAQMTGYTNPTELKKIHKEFIAFANKDKRTFKSYEDAWQQYELKKL